jgi:hypothetical protein
MSLESSTTVVFYLLTKSFFQAGSLLALVDLGLRLSTSALGPIVSCTPVSMDCVINATTGCGFMCATSALYVNPSSNLCAFQEEILDETDEYVNIHNK